MINPNEIPEFEAGKTYTGEEFVKFDGKFYYHNPELFFTTHENFEPEVWFPADFTEIPRIKEKVMEIIKDPSAEKLYGVNTGDWFFDVFISGNRVAFHYRRPTAVDEARVKKATVIWSFKHPPIEITTIFNEGFDQKDDMETRDTYGYFTLDDGMELFKETKGFIINMEVLGSKYRLSPGPMLVRENLRPTLNRLKAELTELQTKGISRDKLQSLLCI